MEQLTCPLAHHAQHAPHRIALYQRHDDAPPTAWSYRQLNRAVYQQQHRLKLCGAKAGQHLVVITQHKSELVQLLFAALRLGLVLIPINPAFPLATLNKLIRRCDAAYVISDSDLLPMAQGNLPENCTQLRPLSQTLTLSPDTTRSKKTASTSGIDLIADANQPLTGIFTSGSTGTPKLVLHSYHNHRASADGSRQLIDLQPGDGWGLSLPLFHVGGLAIVIRSTLAGASLVLPAQNEPLSELLADPHVTHLSAVATQLYQLQQQGCELTNYTLKNLLVGGSAISLGLRHWLQTQSASANAQRHSPQPLRCWTSYGLTEMASQVMTGPLAAKADLAQLLPHCQLRIDHSGEILVRGDSLLLGYYRNGTVEQPWDDHGWFHTRDLGSLDSMGRLTVAGRLDNQFISGGENIQPEQVETVILQYPGITDCIVVPINSPRYGQRPVAFICTGQQAQENSLCSAQLTLWLRQRLAAYQLPQHFLSLPQDDTRLKRSRKELTLLAATSLATAED